MRLVCGCDEVQATKGATLQNPKPKTQNPRPASGGDLIEAAHQIGSFPAVAGEFECAAIGISRRLHLTAAPEEICLDCGQIDILAQPVIALELRQLGQRLFIAALHGQGSATTGEGQIANSTS